MRAGWPSLLPTVGLRERVDLRQPVLILGMSVDSGASTPHPRTSTHGPANYASARIASLAVVSVALYSSGVRRSVDRPTDQDRRIDAIRRSFGRSSGGSTVWRTKRLVLRCQRMCRWGVLRFRSMRCRRTGMRHVRLVRRRVMWSVRRQWAGLLRRVPVYG